MENNYQYDIIELLQQQLLAIHFCKPNPMVVSVCPIYTQRVKTLLHRYIMFRIEHFSTFESTNSGTGVQALVKSVQIDKCRQL